MIRWERPEWSQAGPDVGLAAELDHVQVTVIETEKHWQVAWQVNLNVALIALPEVEEIVAEAAARIAAYLRDDWGATYESSDG